MWQWINGVVAGLTVPTYVAAAVEVEGEEKEEGEGDEKGAAAAVAKADPTEVLQGLLTDLASFRGTDPARLEVTPPPFAPRAP